MNLISKKLNQNYFIGFISIAIFVVFLSFFSIPNLAYAGSFSVVVKDSQTGNGIGGVSILLVADDRSNPAHGRSGSTDGNGFANFGGIDGSFNVEFRKDGYGGADNHLDVGSDPYFEVSMNPNTPTPPPPPPPTPEPTPTPTPTPTTCQDTSANNYGGALPCTYAATTPPIDPNGPQNVQYTISGIRDYYNVRDSGNTILSWTVNVSSFTGPSTMHIRTMGQWSEIAGRNATTEHPFSIPTSGKLDYRNPPESGTFTFSFDTRHATCGRAQIDGSFIDDRTGSDANLFLGMIVDYGVDCAPPPPPAPPTPPATCQDTSANNYGGALPCTYTPTPPPPAPPTVTITANPTNVPNNGSSTLTWTSTNAASCSASVNWSGSKTLSGSELQSNLTSNKTYTITCVGPGGTASATATVAVGPIVNTPPVLTLVGANPMSVTVGGVFTDPGATAQDLEDGNITANIVRTGTVNTAVIGSYVLTYNVSDSQGLAATPVSRTVNVIPITPAPTGSVTFCLILADVNNVIATTSSGLPAGVFSLNLLNNSSTTIQSKTWTTAGFLPNTRIILGSINDSDCVTYSNLSLGNYTYSQLGVTGALWRIPKYNDNQSIQPINNVFDFSPFASSTISDGQISLTSTNLDQRVVIYEYDDPGLSCPAPQITSALTATVQVGTPFTYTITASSTTATTFTATGLPAGLTFNSTTNTISGTPTSSGTFNIQLFAINTCIGGIDSEILVLNVVTTPVPGANLSVSKTANRTSGSAGDSVVYTIVVINSGPDQATSVTANDLIPAGISFISATSTLGSYNSSSGLWSIGTLNNGASAILTINGNIGNGYQGQTITNTVTVSASQSDPNLSNNTASVSLTVPNPACSSNCGGGGGGGGGYSPTSNLGVLKISNVSSARAGDIVNYTIAVTNTGPDHATAVVVADALPDSLTFVSATSTSGNYNSGTGQWTIGNLNNGSSTSLVIYARVKDGYQGQLIRNSANVYAAQTDPYPSNNTAFVDINGTIITNPTPTSCYYLLDYLRKDFNNNPVEVRKLQIFLRDLEGFTSVQITGIYDDQTIVALNAFQARYAADILTPWGHTAPTSYTYILTKKKVNEIYCRMAFPVTPLQQIEIDNYRNFLLSLRNSGIQFPNTGSAPVPVVVPSQGINPPVLYGEVGFSTTSNSSVALATTSTITSRFTANLFYVGSLIAGWFDSWCNWLNWLLLLIIALLSYFWYKEREHNKKIDQINKDLLLK